MFTRVYLCLPMFAQVYLRLLLLPMPTSIYSCLTMFTFLTMFTRVYLCLLVFSYVYSCLPMFITVYRVYL